ncbi:hypothetical protein SUGI_0053460 [Cryptomeria japonica]|nr:hypothetical protein SUGI_0053460 [Cryptomeria japonica]
MVSEGGEFGSGNGSSRLQTDEEIVGAPIYGKGQGKFRSWIDEADEAFPIETIRNLTIDKQPMLKTTTWKDQSLGRPWKVDVPNLVMRGSRDPGPQRKSDASHPYIDSNLRPINSQAWKKNGFSWSNDGWFRNAKLPAPDLARNWKTSRTDRIEAWWSTAPARKQRSNMDRVWKNKHWRRYNPSAHPAIHKLDMFNAKNKGPYTLDGIGVHIIDWKPNFNPQFHTLPENTIWLRLYNCPSDYWHIKIIKDICKELSTFVFVDDILEDRVWGSFIRICINTGHISKILEEVKIIGAEEVWIQRIDREDQLHLCPKCFLREHIVLDCEVSTSILKIYACVQSKPVDMKLVKENTENWEANDVEQSSAASMKEMEKNNPVVYSPLVVPSHQQAHSANSGSAQALLNLLEDAKTLQKDIIIEFAATLSLVPNKTNDFSMLEDEITPPLTDGPTTFDDPGKKGFPIGLEEG